MLKTRLVKVGPSQHRRVQTSNVELKKDRRVRAERDIPQNCGRESRNCSGTQGVVQGPPMSCGGLGRLSYPSLCKAGKGVLLFFLLGDG